MCLHSRLFRASVTKRELGWEKSSKNSRVIGLKTQKMPGKQCTAGCPFGNNYGFVSACGQSRQGLTWTFGALFSGNTDGLCNCGHSVVGYPSDSSKCMPLSSKCLGGGSPPPVRRQGSLDFRCSRIGPFGFPVKSLYLGATTSLSVLCGGRFSPGSNPPTHFSLKTHP